MSKQSENKAAQNYREKHDMCSNCVHFTSDILANRFMYTEEKNKRCGLGGFAVKKTATCDKHETRPGS